MYQVVKWFYILFLTIKTLHDCLVQSVKSETVGHNKQKPIV